MFDSVLNKLQSHFFSQDFFDCFFDQIIGQVDSTEFAEFAESAENYNYVSPSIK